MYGTDKLSKFILKWCEVMKYKINCAEEEEIYDE